MKQVFLRAATLVLVGFAGVCFAHPNNAPPPDESAPYELVLIGENVTFEEPERISIGLVVRDLGLQEMTAPELYWGLSIVWDGKEYEIDPKRVGVWNGPTKIIPKTAWRTVFGVTAYQIPARELTPGKHTVSLKDKQAQSNTLTVFIEAPNEKKTKVESQVTYSTQGAIIQARLKEMRERWNKEKKNSGDFEEYEKFANQMLVPYEGRTSEEFAHLTRTLSKPLLYRQFFKGERQHKVARQMALAALESKDIPVLAEIDLVREVLIERNIVFLPEADFQRARTEDARHWVRAWKSYYASIDENWDPNQEISLQPDPPPGVIDFNSGASPEAIKDPVARAEYKKILAEHQKKIEAHSLQHALRHRMKRFPKTCESHLIRVYSRQPANLPELEKLLTENKIEAEISNRILKAVSAKLKESNGLKARLVMRQAKITNGSGIVATSLELKNDTDRRMTLNLTHDNMTFIVTNGRGHAISKTPILVFNGKKFGSGKLVIPSDRTILAPIGPTGHGIPLDKSAHLDLGLNNCWWLSDLGDEYYLSGVLEIEKADGDEDNQWHGRIELPKVSIPMKPSRTQK